jgi:FKBP-type peptidyl-prolyl cis-trans isomerase 2
MVLKKNDFIKIEFTAKVKDTDNIFDSNIKEDLEKISSSEKISTKPFVFALGQSMFIKGVDNFLIGKSSNPKNYIIELTPEEAFGKRDFKQVQTLSTKIFQKQKVTPYPGAMFNFDGKLGKILTISGGRTIVDFNNPLAGKDVIYNLKILEKVEDLNEKIKALIDFFFRQELKFEIKDKKLIIEADSKFKNFIEMFKDKFNEILNLELEIKEKA